MASTTKVVTAITVLQECSDLDEEIEEYTFRKIEIEGKKGILIEHKSSSSSSNDIYEHEFIEVSEEVDMTRPFDIEKRYSVDKELKTLEQAKQYLKQIKGGEK